MGLGKLGLDLDRSAVCVDNVVAWSVGDSSETGLSPTVSGRKRCGEDREDPDKENGTPKGISAPSSALLDISSMELEMVVFILASTSPGSSFIPLLLGIFKL